MQERYQVVFDGFAVTLPVKGLPTLVRPAFAAHVYPSVRVLLHDEPEPGRDRRRPALGRHRRRGDGIKIGVVDDGVDLTNPFFDPTGFSYPPGFPQGRTNCTTPKVIVARAFAAPGAGRAGDAAARSGRPRSTARTSRGSRRATRARPRRPGPDHPTVTGLSGVAPRAWIGNYRVFSRPTPGGYDAFTRRSSPPSRRPSTTGWT